MTQDGGQEIAPELADSENGDHDKHTAPTQAAVATEHDRPQSAGPPEAATHYLVLMQETGGGEYLGHETLDQVSRLLRELGQPPSDTRLDILLNSAGGHPHATYKLARILRARSQQVRFHIVDYAKSAATMLTLCGDQIVMGAEAELGPLDMQMEHMHLEGRGVFSAIEAVQPMNYFRRPHRTDRLQAGATVPQRGRPEPQGRPRPGVGARRPAIHARHPEDRTVGRQPRVAPAGRDARLRARTPRTLPLAEPARLQAA